MTTISRHVNHEYNVNNCSIIYQLKQHVNPNSNSQILSMTGFKSLLFFNYNAILNFSVINNLSPNKNKLSIHTSLIAPKITVNINRHAKNHIHLLTKTNMTMLRNNLSKLSHRSLSRRCSCCCVYYIAKKKVDPYINLLKTLLYSQANIYLNNN